MAQGNWRNYTPLRHFRSPDETYLPAKERAAREGRTVTEVLNEFLEKYGKDEAHSDS